MAAQKIGNITKTSYCNNCFAQIQWNSPQDEITVFGHRKVKCPECGSLASVDKDVVINGSAFDKNRFATPCEALEIIIENLLHERFNKPDILNDLLSDDWANRSTLDFQNWAESTDDRYFDAKMPMSINCGFEATDEDTADLEYLYGPYQLDISIKISGDPLSIQITNTSVYDCYHEEPISCDIE